MSTISTHVLDTSRGRPASGVAVVLELQNPDESWMQLAHAWTDADGRVKPFFLVEDNLGPGVYRLIFDTESYFSALKIDCFYPQVTIAFRLDDVTQHYHVPLLLNPFGYSTYRGS
jgi:5-hydroxyisourate hydrolase